MARARSLMGELAISCALVAEARLIGQGKDQILVENGFFGHTGVRSPRGAILAQMCGVDERPFVMTMRLSRDPILILIGRGALSFQTKKMMWSDIGFINLAIRCGWCKRYDDAFGSKAEP